MLKDVVEKYYFSQNYNCAEAIIHGANEYYDLGLHEKDMIMAAGFGAGMQTGNTCGTLLSAISILSLRYVEAKAHESKDIHDVTLMLTRKMKERMGSTLCCEIKPKFFNPEIRCKNTVDLACDTLEEVIAEYDAKIGK